MKFTLSSHILKKTVSIWPIAALMAVEAFDVFNNGGYFLGAMTLSAAAVWLILLIQINSNRGSLSGWSVSSLGPLALMGLLWLWTVISMAWSISPDLTLVEINRTGAYFAVLALGIILGKDSLQRTLAACLFLMIAFLGALYGLGPKALPQVVDNLDELARISVPLGYANAQGLLCASALPFSLYFSASRQTNPMLRYFSTLAAPILLICLFFTISRGAMLALAAGLAVFFLLVPFRLRHLGFLLLALVPAALISWWSSGQNAFMENKVDMSLRTGPAADLRLYLLVSAAVTSVLFLTILLAEIKITVPAAVGRMANRAALAAVILAAVLGSVMFIGSRDDFPGYVGDTYRSLSAEKSTQTGAGRLLEVGAAQRWQVWREALANWEEHPVGGTGAQSFPLVHLMLRSSGTSYMKQAHGLPFSLLSELGAVGFTLGLAFIVMAMTVATRNRFRLRLPGSRALSGAMIAFLVIYLIHTAFDWDWNMFALTMAYFLFAGLAIGWRTDEREKTSAKPASTSVS